MKNKTTYSCKSCGYETTQWFGKCPQCDSWESLIIKEQKSVKNERESINAINLSAVTTENIKRIRTGFAEFDRVLGDGIVEDSVILIGGEPGIGKSTLILQVLDKISASGIKTLYFSCEESINQIKIRAERINLKSKDFLLINTTNKESIINAIYQYKPQIVAIDSIQAISSENTQAGTIAQIRDVGQTLTELSKKDGFASMLIGHVTKDGILAGPKALEHLVDVVLYFEEEKGYSYRMLRQTKNRFGPTNEICLFEMKEGGLVEVTNPSMFFISDKNETYPGSIIVSTLEGTKPILVELQSLVSPSTPGFSRRTIMGVDQNRVLLILGILEKNLKLNFSTFDVYLKVVGGIKTSDPAIDLGIALSLSSSLLERVIQPGTVVSGELGLTGEVRRVNQIETRLNEAMRLGFSKYILPQTNYENLKTKEGNINIMPVKTLTDALELGIGNLSS
jgi:DNA repair protein RadA/Sms